MILMQAASISRAIGRGGPWKSRLFWVLKWQRAKRVPFGPKKVEKKFTLSPHHPSPSLVGGSEFNMSRSPPPPTHTARCTELFWNQQRYEKCVRYRPPVHKYCNTSLQINKWPFGGTLFWILWDIKTRCKIYMSRWPSRTVCSPWGSYNTCRSALPIEDISRLLSST